MQAVGGEQGRAFMVEGSSPETWIGQQVAVSVVDLHGNFRGELLEVNDRGLVIRVTMLLDEHDTAAAIQEVQPCLTFHPWNTINKVQVLEADLAEPGDAE